MPTVYFDTSFYVALARADEQRASEVIDGLNALTIRTVLSRTIFWELISRPNWPEKDALLCDRLQRIAAPPYLTFPELTWEMLRTSGAARKAIADRLSSLDETIVEAESSSVMANSTYHHGLRAPAINAIIAEQSFVRSDGTIDIANLGEYIRPFLAQLGVSVPEPLGEADLRALQAVLTDRLKNFDLSALERQTRLTASAVATDPRPYEVMLGRATEGKRRKLAHTYRDAAHMNEFASHSEVIDLFQMDGPQYRQLQRDPEHELRRLGVHTKCFAVGQLEEVLGAVRERLSSC